MKKAMIFLWLALAICLIAPATVKAEAPYLYHHIPFDLTTTDELEKALGEEFGRVTKDDYGMYWIEDFGYSFNMQADFRGRNGVDRLVLHRSGNGYAEGDAFRLLVQQDIDQFIDMENQLIQHYGQPDFRFFIHAWKARIYGQDLCSLILTGTRKGSWRYMNPTSILSHIVCGTMLL